MNATDRFQLPKIEKIRRAERMITPCDEDVREFCRNI